MFYALCARSYSTCAVGLGSLRMSCRICMVVLFFAIGARSFQFKNGEIIVSHQGDVLTSLLVDKGTADVCQASEVTRSLVSGPSVVVNNNCLIKKNLLEVKLIIYSCRLMALLKHAYFIFFSFLSIWINSIAKLDWRENWSNYRCVIWWWRS